MRLVLLLTFVGSFLAAQQPFLYYGGTYHAATYAPAGLPNGGLPRGGLFTVFGRNLGPATPATANAFPLSTNLSGVRLQVLKGTQTFDAYPVFVSAGQINAILPSNAPLGKAVLRLQFNTNTSNIIPIDIVQSNFGIFSINSGGYGPAIVTNFIDPGTQPINSLEQAAQPGQVITIWGSGLGPVAYPDNVAPTAGDLPGNASVFIGGIPAQRLYAGRAPCCSGLDQLVVTIPPNVPQGCWVPIQVLAGGITSNTATIAIATQPNACADPHSPSSSVIRKGGKLARIVTARSSYLIDVANPEPFEFNSDTGFAQFAQYAANPFAWQLLDSLPPPGSCATHTTRGMVQEFTSILPGLSGAALNIGAPISIQAVSTAVLNQVLNLRNIFFAKLGGNYPTSSPVSLFFPVNRELLITSTASAELPAISVRTTPDLSSSWTNRNANFRFRAGQPINLTWAPQQGGLVVAMGSNFNRAKNASSLFACVARSEDAALTVPAYIANTLPRDPASYDAPTGYLTLITIPNTQGSTRTLPGFDAASVFHLNLQSRSVQFR